MGKQFNYDDIPETIAEAVALWDAGDPVWTVEMGGIGPGYEQCIQIFVFALLRACVADPKATPDTVVDRAVAENSYRLGLSSAQFGAALNLAHAMHEQGYRAALKSVSSDRLILVSKRWPTAAAEVTP